MTAPIGKSDPKQDLQIGIVFDGDDAAKVSKFFGYIEHIVVGWDTISRLYLLVDNVYIVLPSFCLIYCQTH